LQPLPDGFGAFDHDGNEVIRLSAQELMVADCFRLPAEVDEALGSLPASGAAALSVDQRIPLLQHLLAVGLLEVYRPEDVSAHGNPDEATAKFRDAMRRKHRVLSAHDEAVAALETAFADDQSLRSKTAVVPAVSAAALWSTPPLALGMLIAYAQVHDGGSLDETYRFHPRWVSTPEQLAEASDEPAIFLFSNYVWCHEENLRLSAHVKRLNPANVTIHGGPDTPAYEIDNQRYFRDNPHVDVTVRGEGEVTFAEILQAFDGNLESLEVLKDVPGLSYRSATGVVRTGDRDRITELDSLPSPYLTGLFDVFAGGGLSIIIETNRGCPYGCTFCDWGSATLSRIRKFDLDRVMAELEWAATNQIEAVYAADANFGIFERDVEIAERVAELNRQHGFPRDFTTNYAKNTVKHLRPIIETLAGAGILTEGKVSLQSMDTETLLTIKRSNIKLEKYDALSTEFREARLPLHVELMMGLPGSTVASFSSDLQECIDRSMPAYVYPTVVLPNSPMNEPSYREENGIAVAPGEFLREAKSFSRDDYERMEQLRSLFILNDKYGVMRQIGLYVQHEAGLRQIDLYARLFDAARQSPERWATIRYVLVSTPELMGAPGSWRWFIDELRDFLVSSDIVVDDSALETALTVQHALLPAAGRRFPLSIELAHDYAAWHREIDRAKAGGGWRTWPESVPSLREFGPATFVVDDPRQICRVGIGRHIEHLNFSFTDWELGSPVRRAAVDAVAS
jgi:radical SAM superfamily enzyme YgiQ (UPF0313 family)